MGFGAPGVGQHPASLRSGRPPKGVLGTYHQWVAAVYRQFTGETSKLHGSGLRERAPEAAAAGRRHCPEQYFAAQYFRTFASTSSLQARIPPRMEWTFVNWWPMK